MAALPNWKRRVAALSSRAAAAAGGVSVFDDDASALTALVYNLDVLREAVRELRAAFPADTLHTFASKACLLQCVMDALRAEHVGVETASPGELALALHYGFDAEHIVHDSPAKTRAELRRALAHGIRFNLDNAQELARVDALLADATSDDDDDDDDDHGDGERDQRAHQCRRARAGLRINPQIGAGTIKATSTASLHSKFGFGLRDYGMDALVAMYVARPWLVRVHCHVGSQGCDFDLEVAGVRAAVELAAAVNDAVGRKQVTEIDIGGGLPVNFASEDVVPTFAQYADELYMRVPELREYRVITEFGRTLAAKAGVLLSTVEYTKRMGDRPIVTQHLGADLLVRVVYHPDAWPVRVTFFDGATGEERTGATQPTDVAGPCCFTADVIAHLRELPTSIAPGDIVMVHEAGAYFHSQFSRYNARLAPAVLLYDAARDELRVVRSAETLDDLMHFFGNRS